MNTSTKEELKYGNIEGETEKLFQGLRDMKY